MVKMPRRIGTTRDPTLPLVPLSRDFPFRPLVLRIELLLSALRDAARLWLRDGTGSVVISHRLTQNTMSPTLITMQAALANTQSHLPSNRFSPTEKTLIAM